MKCPTCHEAFTETRRPYVLFCGHSLCSHCLKRQTECDMGHIEIRCTRCNKWKRYQGMPDIPVNLYVEENAKTFQTAFSKLTSALMVFKKEVSGQAGAVAALPASQLSPSRGGTPSEPHSHRKEPATSQTPTKVPKMKKPNDSPSLSRGMPHVSFSLGPRVLRFYTERKYSEVGPNRYKRFDIPEDLPQIYTLSLTLIATSNARYSFIELSYRDENVKPIFVVKCHFGGNDAVETRTYEQASDKMGMGSTVQGAGLTLETTHKLCIVKAPTAFEVALDGTSLDTKMTGRNRTVSRLRVKTSELSLCIIDARLVEGRII